jgi:hypothetical protein
MPVNRKVSDPPRMAGKTDLPPPLPVDTLERVIRLARTDGRLLLVIAGLFAAMSAMGLQQIGAIAGCLAAGCGALEVHGANLLRQGDPRGLRWLVRSQLALLAVIAGYVVARLLTFDPELMRSLITDEMRTTFAQAGIQEEDILPMVKAVYQFMYGAVAFVSLLYQGGMALYYRRKAPAVEAALEDAGSDG